MLKTFSILISTRNRLNDLIFTLQKIEKIIYCDDVECIVFDDGSTDGTSFFLKNNFPGIKVFRNEESKGYLFCRNKMLNETKATYAISLDDDAHFVTENPLEIIEKKFIEHPNCGLIAFRIFWGTALPNSLETNENSEQVKGFVGCGHAWRMHAWREIPNYPEWFVFYGEEEFASYQLFKINKKIIYEPTILVNHRVDVLLRKNNNDYQLRLRRSLRSGWYLYLLFFPLLLIPKKIAYTLWIQLKNKTFKGDFKATIAIIQAVFDVLINLPKLVKNSNRFSYDEYRKFEELPVSKIFWKPKQ